MNKSEKQLQTYLKQLPNIRYDIQSYMKSFYSELMEFLEGKGIMRRSIEGYINNLFFKFEQNIKKSLEKIGSE